MINLWAALALKMNQAKSTDREQTDHEAMISLLVFITDFVKK